MGRARGRPRPLLIPDPRGDERAAAGGAHHDAAILAALARRTIVAALVVMSLLGAGCGNAILADASAAPTGCVADEIEITNRHTPMQGPSWWTASCQGQVYFCSLLHEDVFCSTDPRDAAARNTDTDRKRP